MSQDFYKNIVSFKKQQGCALPDATIARKFVHHLFETLFICKTEADNNEFEVKAQLEKSENQLGLVLYPLFKNEAIANKQAAIFFEKIPAIYELLLEDANAIFKADPAAKELDQVLIAYPGFFAIAVYRFAHQLYQQHISLLPRIFTEYAHSRTGIDIHPAAQIGKGLAIDHGTGIVIGETAIIGNNVKIYQGVTLGALSVLKEKASEKRHPTIQDNVVIYSGATILGGETIIGHDSIIGGNVWLTQSVDPFSIVYHQAEVKVQDKKSFVEPINFFI
jgi:serine O-acetyltransferase